MATVDYMVAAYGEYSASATGGNALARDVLAGAAAMYSSPCKFYIPLYSPMYTYLNYHSVQQGWKRGVAAVLANPDFDNTGLAYNNTGICHLLERTDNSRTLRVCLRTRQDTRGDRGSKSFGDARRP